MDELKQYEIRALDGDLGHVKDFYFDDDAWVIRYLVVETGGWMSRRDVLISPISIRRPDWPGRILPISITRAQVESSPDIETHLPVSRQHEMQYSGHYGYPYYWNGGGLWGTGSFPYAMAAGYEAISLNSAQQETADARYEGVQRAIHRNDDPHLRSCKAVIGYHIHATDGDVGHVEGLLVDEDSWAIRYLVVDTSNWWFGHKVLVAPEWVTDIDWAKQRVTVDVRRDFVRKAPPYESANEFNRQREGLLYDHYGKIGYWEENDVAEAGLH